MAVSNRQMPCDEARVRIETNSSMEYFFFGFVIPYSPENCAVPKISEVAFMNIYS